MNKLMEKFVEGKLIVNTKTQKEYDEFMKILEDRNFKWGSGHKPTHHSNYNIYKKSTCIGSYNKKLSYCDIDWYKKKGYEIVSYKQFRDSIYEKNITKNDLQEGDILTLRNGKVGVFSEDMNIDGLWREHINDDLTNNGGCGKELDIVKVERPVKFETIFERKENILDNIEKEYLRNIIKPFRNKKIRISKLGVGTRQFIEIKINNESITLPFFKANIMYKNMKKNVAYTIEELGL